jgi:hypothetical protein
MALNKQANLPNVPVITELVRDDREREMITALFAPETMGSCLPRHPVCRRHASPRCARHSTTP